jgi:hypothetical protein
LLTGGLYRRHYIAESANIADKNLWNFTIFLLNRFSANIAEIESIAEMPK